MTENFKFPPRDRMPRGNDDDDFPFDAVVRFPPADNSPHFDPSTPDGTPFPAFEIGDFGAETVEPIPEASRALEGGNLEHGLARAMVQLDDFTEALIRDPDFESHADKFRQGVKIICDGVCDTLPDGDASDSFKERFNLATNVSAVALRDADTRRLVARNRAGLDAALASYARLAGGAANQLTSKFAVDQAFNAIDRQVTDGVVSFEEGRDLERGFFTRIEDEAARKLIELDPAIASVDLRDATLYPELGDGRRNELAGIAQHRASQARLDEETAKAREARAAAAARAEAARTFTTGFKAKLRGGTATAVEIGVAEADGVIDREQADRLVARFRDDEGRRVERARLGGIAMSAVTGGGALDPSDPEHAAAADVHFEDVLRPALIAARTPDEIGALRDEVVALGAMPHGLRRLLDIHWRSADPDLASKAIQTILGPDDPGALLGDAAAVPEIPLLDQLRPGMVEAFELMRSGLAAEQAVPLAVDMARKQQEEAATGQPTRPTRASGSTAGHDNAAPVRHLAALRRSNLASKTVGGPVRSSKVGDQSEFTLLLDQLRPCMAEAVKLMHWGIRAERAVPRASRWRRCGRSRHIRGRSRGRRRTTVNSPRNRSRLVNKECVNP